MSPSLPQHLAIIMDGNGRWAQEKKLPRIEGHRQGVKTFKNVVKWCKARKIPYLTCYAFSTENWTRPESEVKFLMQLLRFFARKERKELIEDGVRVQCIGDLSRLPRAARAELEKTIAETSKNNKIIVQLALSYSGRDEVLRAVKKILRDQKSGKLLDEGEINEDLFDSYLDTKGIPDPDLVIRTSGELRTSNFLIWQAAYSEYYFSSKFWPDFDEQELDCALESFDKRKRRFGGVEEKRSIKNGGGI